MSISESIRLRLNPGAEQRLASAPLRNQTYLSQACIGILYDEVLQALAITICTLSSPCGRVEDHESADLISVRGTMSQDLFGENSSAQSKELSAEIASLLLSFQLVSDT
nr:hypothetical protein Iba_chr15eCG6380 [Ipomoea batatas]